MPSDGYHRQERERCDRTLRVMQGAKASGSCRRADGGHEEPTAMRLQQQCDAAKCG